MARATRTGVAVIIPTYNRRDLVVRAVRSVLRQSYSDLCCAVVDNGSTDGTADALTALGDPRVKVLSQATPMGGPAARNLGIAATEGTEWVAFLDSDDLWAPTKIERQLAALSLHPGSAWSATSCVNVGQSLQVLQALRLVEGPPGVDEVVMFSPEQIRTVLKEDNHIPSGNSTVMVSRALLDECGYFDPSLATCDDWDLWLRLAARSPMAYVDRPLAGYLIWEGQSSSNERAFTRDAMTVRARNFPEGGPPIRHYIARWDREAGRRHVAAGRRWRAARNYARAAWFGMAPGQLAYAVAAAAAPKATERRLAHIERGQRLPAGWQAEAEGWLGPYRAG